MYPENATKTEKKIRHFLKISLAFPKYCVILVIEQM